MSKVDIDAIINLIKSDKLCNWTAGDNCDPIQKAVVNVMNNILPLCLELKAARALIEQSRIIIAMCTPLSAKEDDRINEYIETLEAYDEATNEQG